MTSQFCQKKIKIQSIETFVTVNETSADINQVTSEAIEETTSYAKSTETTTISQIRKAEIDMVKQTNLRSASDRKHVTLFFISLIFLLININ